MGSIFRVRFYTVDLHPYSPGLSGLELLDTSLFPFSYKVGSRLNLNHKLSINVDSAQRILNTD